MNTRAVTVNRGEIGTPGFTKIDCKYSLESRVTTTSTEHYFVTKLVIENQ